MQGCLDAVVLVVVYASSGVRTVYSVQYTVYYILRTAAYTVDGLVGSWDHQPMIWDVGLS